MSKIVIGVLFTLQVAVIVLLAWAFSQPEPVPEPQPIVHDVCVIRNNEYKCHTVPFYPGAFTVNDEQVWAVQPNGSIIYISRVEYVGLCVEKCEVAK